MLHLWNQAVFGGTVKQGIGLVMPMGLFFLAAHLLHVPVWVAERIWLAAILTVACWGVVRLAEALGVGTRWTRVVAGVAYCIAPIVVTYATYSGYLLATVFLPWMLCPLVVGSREGSTRRAAARSGVAVALMGGANAAVTLATLPLGIIWFLTRKPGPRRRSLARWWVIAVGLASFWWIMSLAFVAHFGYNYLPYTETSSITTSTTSVFESIRGASFWLNYFHLGGPLLRGAWILVSEPGVIVGTAVVAAFGLAGLCRPISERPFLVSCLAFGVVVMSAGFAGSMGGLFSHQVQQLLQGSLAPFRNVSKFSPDVTLPLAIGLAGMLSTSWRPDRPHLQVKRHLRSLWAAVTIFAVVAVVVAAAPFWRGQLYRSGGFPNIPRYWQLAGAFLNEHQGHENTLLVPGASFASYTWGDPVDEPLQDVAATSVEWLNVIPIGSNGYVQMMQAVEQALDSGTAPAGLAEYLSREGINYVVERNDLNLSATGAPLPAQVHQVLSETPGLTEVASFGPYLPLTQVEYGSLPVYNSNSYLQLRPVEIFRVDSTASAVQTFPAVDPVVISGDVGSIVPLSGAGVLTDRASVLSGDQDARGVAAAPGATWAITDGNQRTTTAFGTIRYNQSYLLGAGQELPTAQPDIPDGFNVVSGGAHQTVEAPIGAKSVAASSFGATALVSLPDEGPAAAFDNDPYTSWVANVANNSVGQWVSITFDKPILLSTITVTPVPGSAQQPTITRIKITTDRGTVYRGLPPGQRSYRVSVSPGHSRHLKVTLTGVTPATKPTLGGIVLSAGITGIAIPGVSFQPRMLLPNDESARFSTPESQTVVALERPIANYNLGLGLAGTDDPDMSREFSIPRAETMSASGYAVPQPGSSLGSLIKWFNPVPAGGLKVTASSTLGGLPRFSARNLVDGSPQPWIAAVGDRSPSLNISWKGKHPVSSLLLTLTPTSSRPTEVSITPAGGNSVLIPVSAKGGVLTFPTVVTDSLTVRFLRVDERLSATPNFDIGLRLPVGLAAVAVPGLLTAPVAIPNMAKPFALACGRGPTVMIDGKTMETSITGTIGDLLDLEPVALTLCIPSSGLTLPAGIHTFQSEDTGSQFLVTSFVMQAAHSDATADQAHRSASVVQWAAEHRTIRVGPGPATYLVVSQNYNTGWVAKVAGRTLKPVRN